MDVLNKSQIMLGGSGARLYNKNSFVMIMESNEVIQSVMLGGIWELAFGNGILSENYVQHENLISLDQCLFYCGEYTFANYFWFEKNVFCRCSNSHERQMHKNLFLYESQGIYVQQRVKRFKINVATAEQYPNFREVLCNEMPCMNKVPYFVSNTYRCGNGENEINTIGNWNGGNRRWKRK